MQSECLRLLRLIHPGRFSSGTGYRAGTECTLWSEQGQGRIQVSISGSVKVTWKMMLSPSLAVNLPRISTKKLPTKNKSKPLKSELTAFNIPPAVRRKKVQTVDIYFKAKKKALAHRLPVLSSEEIKRYETVQPVLRSI